MADAIRGAWQSVVNTKRMYLNPHEHFGRMNITRAVLASYIAIFMAVKWNGKRKAKLVQKQMIKEKENVLKDAMVSFNILYLYGN